VHEAAHAVVAVLLGMKARAVLQRGRPGCGTCDIDVPEGADGSQRLLVALVAGSEGEGRLLHQARAWRASTEDARAMLRLIGGLARPGSAERLADAKHEASRLVRDARVWRAIEAVAAELTSRRSVEDATIREATAAAGLRPVHSLREAAKLRKP
jgi:hypothetical protein